MNILLEKSSDWCDCQDEVWLLRKDDRHVGVIRRCESNAVEGPAFKWIANGSAGRFDNCTSLWDAAEKLLEGAGK